MQLQITERDKKLLIVLGFVVLIFALGYGGIYPILLHNDSLKERLAQTNEARSQMEGHILMVSGYRAQTTQAKEEQETLYDSFYSGLTGSMADQLLTDICMKNGGMVQSVSLEQSGEDTAEVETYRGETVTLEGIRQIRASITVTGERSRIGGILDDIGENSPAMLIRGYVWRDNTLTVDVSIFGTTGEE